MKETDGGTSVRERQEKLASAFGQTLDPLAEYEQMFKQADVDVFDLFIEDVLEARGLNESTKQAYICTFGHWKEHMRREGRHPACPTEEHVKSFIYWRMDEKGNSVDTVKNKLRHLGSVYEYWQNESSIGIPQDYNPIQLAKSKVSFGTGGPKESPRIPLEELREYVQSEKHIRNRAMIALQLKLGLRAGEVTNIQLRDVDIRNSELRKHFPILGSAHALEDRKNALYVPHDRDGNKSKRPRVLPLDDEIRRLLVRYLLIRPDAGSEWLFLSDQENRKLWTDDVNQAWRDVFWPDYEENERFRAVTSHYGRHFFTTYWKIHQEMGRDLVQYMRGDEIGEASVSDRAGIDSYLHAYYEDIEEEYLENVFKLHV